MPSFRRLSFYRVKIAKSSMLDELFRDDLPVGADRDFIDESLVSGQLVGERGLVEVQSEQADERGRNRTKSIKRTSVQE
jgi:hypothetical protein